MGKKNQTRKGRAGAAQGLDSLIIIIFFFYYKVVLWTAL